MRQSVWKCSFSLHNVKATRDHRHIPSLMKGPVIEFVVLAIFSKVLPMMLNKMHIKSINMFVRTLREYQTVFCHAPPPFRHVSL